VECPQKELACAVEKNTWICGLDLIYRRTIYRRDGTVQLIVKEEACNVPKGAAYVHSSQRRASSVAL
jgi:hypothetical protein